MFAHYFTLAAYPAEGRLVLAPAALGGARSIRYTARLEIATVVPRALAQCRFSKSHHRPARVAAIGPCRSRTTGQRRRARDAPAASTVALVPFLNPILCRNGQFCTVFRIFTHKGSKFSGCFYPFTSTYNPYDP